MHMTIHPLAENFSPLRLRRFPSPCISKPGMRITLVQQGKNHFKQKQRAWLCITDYTQRRGTQPLILRSSWSKMMYKYMN